MNEPLHAYQTLQHRILVGEEFGPLVFQTKLNCESLPNKRNLFSRKVTRCATFDRCKEEIEDVIHALWGYQALKEVWWEEPSFRN